MPRVVHFDIHADDPDRAIAFYSALFGWQFAPFPGGEYWVITTGPSTEPGIDGGMARRRGGTGDRINSYVCIVDVPDIDAAIAKAKELGAPEAVPKNEIPGIGWSAYFLDTEQNVFGIYQSMQRPAGQGT